MAKADQAWVSKTIDAFIELTGTKPVDNEAAWKVFFKTLLAIREPTPERAAWVKRTADPFMEMTPDQMRSDVLPRVRAFQESGQTPTAADLRRTLKHLAPEFGKLSQETVTTALALDPTLIPAELSLSVHAFGDRRNPDESHEKARRRVAGSFLKAAKRASKTSSWNPPLKRPKKK